MYTTTAPIKARLVAPFTLKGYASREARYAVRTDPFLKVWEREWTKSTCGYGQKVGWVASAIKALIPVDLSEWEYHYFTAVRSYRQLNTVAAEWWAFTHPCKRSQAQNAGSHLHARCEANAAGCWYEENGHRPMKPVQAQSYIVMTVIDKTWEGYVVEREALRLLTIRAEERQSGVTYSFGTQTQDFKLGADLIGIRDGQVVEGIQVKTASFDKFMRRPEGQRIYQQEEQRLRLFRQTYPASKTYFVKESGWTNGRGIEPIPVN